MITQDASVEFNPGAAKSYLPPGTQFIYPANLRIRSESMSSPFFYFGDNSDALHLESVSLYSPTFLIGYAGNYRPMITASNIYCTGARFIRLDGNPIEPEPNYLEGAPTSREVPKADDGYPVHYPSDTVSRVLFYDYRNYYYLAHWRVGDLYSAPFYTAGCRRWNNFEDFEDHYENGNGGLSTEASEALSSWLCNYRGALTESLYTFTSRFPDSSDILLLTEDGEWLTPDEATENDYEALPSPA